MTKTLSPLQQARHDYRPKVPTVLAKGAAVAAVDGPRQEPASDREELRALFPHTYGLPLITFKTGAPPSREPVNVAVILSGGQAPGGHNVIAGLYDGLQSLNPASRLFGFLGGPSGLIQNKYVELTGALVDDYRNTGGFDIIGSGRTKLEKPADFDTVAENCKRLNISAIVIVGGDDSNTNACVLAEYYAKRQVPIRVVGCPKTIDGDLKNAFIEASFGFDTASRVYSELIGNIERDANSAKKYYHFIKLMGRSASHIALECALQTQPNVCLISEEIAAKQKTLNEIVDDIVRVVVARAAKGKNFGVVLIPEGLIEFVPEMKKLIGELNDLLAQGRSGNDFAKADSEDLLLGLGLSRGSVTAFLSLPNHIRDQLVLDRDDHGNVKVSQIETEKMLIEMVEARLARYKAEGTYKGKFAGLSHFFGYEGRCAPPSNFDADYCTSLGCTAAALVAAGQTGYLASVRHLARPATEWEAGGIPLTSMMNLERRHGATKPVIRKALVDLNGKPFGALAANRERWATEDEFLFPGPIQYFGPAAVCDAPSKTLQLEHS